MKFKFFDFKLSIFIISIILGILVSFSVFLIPAKQIIKEDFNEIKSLNLEIPKYLTIQSNSLLPILNFKGEKLTFTVTAYYLVPWQTDEDPCIIASGINACELKEKKIVACPRKYPFGTKFLINGEIWECQDRLSLKYDDRIDLLVENEKEMRKWGKRTIEVIKLE